ncbi:MAG: hypothetical protein WAW92_02370 [Minisyncoccia bacterium]
MPAIPTGGISIFVNIAIVIIGGVFSMFRKFGYISQVSQKFYNLIVDKKFDSVLRRLIGYTIVALVFGLIFTTTAISITKRITGESNITLIKNVINR